MCNFNAKVTTGHVEVMPSAATSEMNGRPVLQPNCNRVSNLEKQSSLKKTIPTNNKSRPPPICPPSYTRTKPFSLATPPISPKASLTTPPMSPSSKSPRPPAMKRANDNGMNSSSEKVNIPKGITKTPSLDRKKSKSFSGRIGNGLDGLSSGNESSLSYSSSLILEAPGSIAAVRREHMALQQAQRKMKIAHYGRSKSAKFDAKIFPVDFPSNAVMTKPAEDELKRCSFITANTDPIYLAYHDEEWGVPVHDDKLLFELLVLSGAQVGSDWTSILKNRQDYRSAFADFDADIVAKFSDKQMMSITTEYGIDISRVRGVVDNSNRVLEVKKEFGSFETYMWAFVNNKPICPQYKLGYKIPVKTSKSESISKNMLKRGFRMVGPTVVHSFMQAAGLTNDHLTTCHRHVQCNALLADHSSPVPLSQ